MAGEITMELNRTNEFYGLQLVRILTSRSVVIHYTLVNPACLEKAETTVLPS